MGERWSRIIRALGPVRILAVALTALLGGLISYATWGGASSDVAGDAPPPSTASQERGMVTGRPLQDPAVVDGPGAAQQVTITLTAGGTAFDLSGRRVWGQTYNGSFIAPTIHAQPGSDVAITLVNQLSKATNLHFHGLHVSPGEDGDNPFLCVAAHSTLTYHLAVPADHPQGTFWYHSHAMGTTCPATDSTGMSGTAGMDDMPGMNTDSGPAASSRFTPGDVENQIIAGLSGALIVGDDRSLLPPPLRDVTAHTLVLKDAQIDPTGHLVQNSATHKIDSNAPTVRLINGQLRPVLTMRPGETQLWRLVNAGADIFYPLQLDGSSFTVIGEDGVPVAAVTTPEALLLPPGKRYDVLVTAGRSGTTTLRSAAYGNGEEGDSYPDTAVAAVAVTGPAAPPLPPVTGAIPTAPAPLDTTTVAARRTVDLTQSADDLSFFINGKQFAMGDGSVFDTPAHLGTVEEWTIVNHTEEEHPFHLHTAHFQVMSINDTPMPYTHMQDTVLVPHSEDGAVGTVVIRIPFNDFAGKWMFHCHIAAHEDNGMMSYINVIP